MKEKTEWRLTFSLERKRPGGRKLGVKGEKREEVEPEERPRGITVHDDFTGLVEEIAQGGGQRYLEEMGEKRVARLLEEAPEIRETVEVVLKRSHGLTEECLTELNRALARHAGRTGEEYDKNILQAATHPL